LWFYFVFHLGNDLSVFGYGVIERARENLRNVQHFSSSVTSRYEKKYITILLIHFRKHPSYKGDVLWIIEWQKSLKNNDLVSHTVEYKLSIHIGFTLAGLRETQIYICEKKNRTKHSRRRVVKLYWFYTNVTLCHCCNLYVVFAFQLFFAFRLFV